MDENIDSLYFTKGLNELRDKLIDTSRRNKLINYKKPSKANYIKIIDESATFIYKYLVLEEKKFKFKAVPDPEVTSEDIEENNENIKELQIKLNEGLKEKIISEEEIKNIEKDIEQLKEKKAKLEREAFLTPEERASDLGYNTSTTLIDVDLTNPVIDEKYVDEYLQTLHYSNEMNKILTNISRAANSIIDETGTNMLYITLAILSWNESGNSEQYNNSPLISIPIKISKSKSKTKNEFILEYTGAGLNTNISLSEKLSNDYNIVLPELTEETQYLEYLQKVHESIKHKKSWSLKQEAVIDVLKFGKILMYQDLKEDNWKEKLIDKQIFRDIFIGKDNTNLPSFAEEYNIDKDEIAINTPLVMEADSSQHSAIVDIIKGKNTIIEGPPGTGKSQTISNIIASLLSENKTILFVSEKLAALEVVHKRLASIGLADFCLELHSHKSQKQNVLKSIQKRLETKYYNPTVIEQKINEINYKKEEIQKYISLLHKEYGSMGEKIYDILWATEKYQKTSEKIRFEVVNANSYTKQDFFKLEDKLKSYQKFLLEHNFAEFYWKGIDTYKLTYADYDEFVIYLKEILNILYSVDEQYQLLGLEIENEYGEMKNISYFVNNFPQPIQEGVFEYISKLFNVSNEDAIKYFENVEQYKKEIDSLKSQINMHKKIGDVCNTMVPILNKIRKKIKQISKDTGISKSKNYADWIQLLNGISHLSKIDEDLYGYINNKYIDSKFLEVFANLKADVNEYDRLKNALSKNCKLEVIDNISLKQITSIEEIIEDKKDSIFSIFSSEFRSAKKELSLMFSVMPSDKNEWLKTIKKVREYIVFVENFKANEKYKIFFGELFNGFSTNIKTIEKLKNWSDELLEHVSNYELQGLFINGDKVVRNTLLSYQKELEQLNNKFLENLVDMENVFPSEILDKIYSKRNKLNMTELKKYLEPLGKNINDYLETLYEYLDENGQIEDEFLELARDSKSEIFIQNLIKKDITQFEISKKLQSIGNNATYLKKFCDKLQADLSSQTIAKISNALSIAKYVNNSTINANIKQKFIENNKTFKILQEIAILYTKIENIYQELLKYCEIKDSFFEKNAKIKECIIKLEKLDDNKSLLSPWSNFMGIVHELNNKGLEEITKKVEENNLLPDDIQNAFRYNFYNTLSKEIFRQNILFSKFSRVTHEQAIETFRMLDKELIEYNKQKVAYQASQVVIPEGIRSNKIKELTELSLIEHEMRKKTKHIPIRQLISRSADALQAIKPCFMMSPLSVSQYLPQNNIDFDVLIIDEASQLKPEEALGAIARVKQIVIVGDPKQLPPTDFFDTLGDKDEDETVASTSESILDICLNLYKPIRRLRWHYRSRHETLIEFSNNQFYDKDLIIFPSPTSKNNDELGIKYHYVENSYYQNKSNKIEAVYVVQHIEQQMKKYPNKSLGIGTFNITQKNLIQSLLDVKEKKSPIISEYINKWEKASEPFFIKNLENLQGDERDVIFLSTTYGKDKEAKKVFQRFGPINSDTGWRRLNVLLTRSKQKMEIFTSMKSSDINISENSSRGVRSLKAFLKYLENGIIQDEPKINPRGFDSEFEESVYNILSDCGFKSIPQVGVAGYFIDLAVCSEYNESDYVLAIECDGATYHSSKSARDRDRLRQEVLENLGWKVYRIWSVDWYKNREYEISKLIAAVKDAQLEFKSVHTIETEEKNNDIQVKVANEKSIDIEDKDVIIKTKTPTFYSDNELRIKLIDMRENVISREFDIDQRCILSDLMIGLFIKYKPIDMDEFRNKIPLKYRDKKIIDISQMKFLEAIFDILDMAE